MKLNQLIIVLVTTYLLSVASFADSSNDKNTKNILVFGDSLTWGWYPTKPIIPTTRHPNKDRWTTALATKLGVGYHIVVEGLSGRTTNIDDPSRPTLNGAPYLQSALASHEPLDLVIIMLGTNDTKATLKRSPLEIGLGMGELINIAQEHPGGWNRTNYPAPKVLVISPPPLAEKVDPLIEKLFAGAREKTQKLPPIYAAITKAAGEYFFDAGSVISSDGIDGVHFTAATNKKLGNAVAEKVRQILPQAPQLELDTHPQLGRRCDR